MANLLNVNDALERILSHIKRLSDEHVSLDESIGRVLAEDVIAAYDLPPFANSSMDGYAVRSNDIRQANKTTPVTLRLVMDIPAGSAPKTRIETGQAARIMTGAPLPEGADAVIPVEDTDANWAKADDVPLPDTVTIYRSVDVGAYVRSAGEDIASGEKVLERGVVLRPQEVGILAALGHGIVKVVRRPRVALLSSGDELVPVEQALGPGQIHDVNRYTLAGLIRKYGGVPIILPPSIDTLTSVRSMFLEALVHQPDMIISSGGASVGTADFIYTVLDELGDVDFWKVNLRPGKPLAFGNLRGVPFFGLPGNPVSAMVTFDVLVRPALLRQSAFTDDWQEVQAIVNETVRSDGRRSYIRVNLSTIDGQLYATLTGTQSSGALLSMVSADGLLIIPEEVTQIVKGQIASVRLLRSI